MKSFIISFLLVLTVASEALISQDFQVSAMNGYSVSYPLFDVANSKVYLAMGTNFRFYQFPQTGPTAPISNPVNPAPNNWAPLTTSVAVNPVDGKIVILYDDFNSSTPYKFEVRSVSSSDDGVTWSTASVVSVIKFGTSFSSRWDIPKVMFSSLGNEYMMYFVENNQIDTNIIVFKRTNGATVKFKYTHLPYAANFTVKTINSVDNIYFTYFHNQNFYFRKSTDNGDTFSQPVSVFDIGMGFIHQPNQTKILIDSNNKLYYTFKHYNSPTYLVTSTDFGNTWSSPIGIDNSEYCVLNLGADNALVKSYVSDSNIYFSTSGTNGSSWGTPQKLNSTTGTFVPPSSFEGYHSSKIVGNQIAAAWIDNRTGNSEIFYGIKNLPATNVNETQNALPKNFTLEQNFPNPFNPSTTIGYTIDSKEFDGTTKVTLKVFDLLGNEVAVLVDENKEAGNYLVNWDASKFTAGVYFYSLKAGGAVETKKLILLK